MEKSLGYSGACPGCLPRADLVQMSEANTRMTNQERVQTGPNPHCFRRRRRLNPAQTSSHEGRTRSSNKRSRLILGFYCDRIIPWLVDQSMRQPRLLPYRGRIASAASGRVLEIGIGSGLNLPFYGRSVSEIVGIEPSPKLLDLTREVAKRASMPLELIEGTAEAIPIEDRSVDAVVTTWTMCSVPAVERALGEAHRVLRPGGRLLFVEHGRAPEPRVRWWQDYLTPAWRLLSGGCHLNRPIDEIIRHSGFCIERLDKGYMRGPKLMAFMYEGSARPE